MSITAKPWWRSRTILGAVVSLLAMVAGPLGVDLDAELQSEIVTILLTLGGVVGPVLSVWGRMKARSRIAPPGRGTLGIWVIVTVLAATALGGPSACATHTVAQADRATPAQIVYAVQSDYTAALRVAAAHVSAPDADPDVVRTIQRLDAAAFDAIGQARIAVRTSTASESVAAIATARAAVAALTRYLVDEGIAR